MLNWRRFKTPIYFELKGLAGARSKQWVNLQEHDSEHGMDVSSGQPVRWATDPNHTGLMELSKWLMLFFAGLVYGEPNDVFLPAPGDDLFIVDFGPIIHTEEMGDAFNVPARYSQGVGVRVPEASVNEIALGAWPMNRQRERVPS